MQCKQHENTASPGIPDRVVIAPRQKGRSGGPGTAAGVDFQARLAAWVACAILAETDAPPIWDWPETDTLEAVYAETDQPADDLLVETSGGARAYVQAKYRLLLSESASSQFGGAVGQVVRQFRRSQRPAPSNDRLVLAVGPTSSAPVREHLPRILVRARALPMSQPISATAKNKEEQKALATLLAHLEREWSNDAGSAPSDAEVRAVLRRLRVSVHDLYDDGAEIREAKTLLRQSVLKEPNQAGVVFDSLVAAAVGSSADQIGTNRVSLQSELTGLGIALRAAPSYRSDLEKLVAHSQRTVQQLERFASVAGAGGMAVTIERTAPTALRQAVDQRSVVVTGDPGAGKSATLFEFARTAIAEGRDALVLASDTLAAASLGELRQELGLQHDILDVLINWPGAEPAYLVVDALDAARGEHTQQTLLDLIGAAGAHAERWRIAASIRRFDLRYNQNLKALFGSRQRESVDAFQSAEFGSLSHFNVPVLSDEELGQLQTLAPSLHRIVDGAGVELRSLLRVPFNLRLLAELTALGVAHSELAPITTQLQLLEKYWQHWVLAGTGGDLREAVLRAACEAIIEARALRLSRSVLQTDPAFATPLSELLSAQVLVEDEADGVARREVIAFAHHVLFDYAVARLVLRGIPQTVVQRTRANPELLLVVRPSYDVHCRYLWEQTSDRRPFWELAIDLAGQADLPAIGVVIAPGVAAQLIESLTDVQPLLRAIDATDLARRAAAQDVLQHLIGARLAVGAFGLRIPLDGRLVWAEIAAALAVTLRAETAFAVRNLLMELCEKPGLFDDAQRGAAGPAARALLNWSLNAPQHNQYLVRTGISAVARTYPSDPAAAEGALRPILDRGRLSSFGYVEMPALANEVPHLVEHAADLVRDIYDVAFDHQETSDEPTSMREGVLALNSHRSQDYTQAHYALAQAYPGFIKVAPAEALDALSRVWLSFIRHRRSGEPSDQPPIVVQWKGAAVEIQPDGSYWHERDDSHDEEVKMLSAFGQWLAEVAATGTRAARQALTIVSAGARPTSVWRRVLRVAAGTPEPFVPLLEPLITTPAAVASHELEDAAGHFLKAGFGHFSQAARRRIERAIMSIPAVVSNPRIADPDRARHRAEQSRDRLLGCLDEALLVTPGARAHLAALTAADGIPALRDRHVDGGWTGGSYTDRDELAEQGVDVDAVPNRRLQDLQTPVEAFATTHLNGSPPAEALVSIEAPLQGLWHALQSAPDDGADQRQIDVGWGRASAAAEAIARGQDLAVDSSVVVLAREILLASATHPLPAPREDPSQFDEFQSWGGSSPRIHAAKGLLYLARHQELATTEVLGALDQLSTEEVPAVRFQVAQRLGLLLKTAPDAMWSIADRMLAQDPSMAIINALVHALRRMTLPNGALDRLQAAIRAAFARATDDRAGAANVRESCVQTMTSLYVMRGADDAGRFVDDVIVGDMKAHPEHAGRIVHVLRDAFTHGDIDPSATEDNEIRRRAIRLAEELLEHATTAFATWNTELAGQDLDREHPDIKAARTTAQIIDSVAKEVYFATGIFDERQNQDSRVSPGQRERLYSEAASLLDRLCDVGFAHSTHCVIETHEAFIPFDARGSFLRIARTVKAGQAGGYDRDSLAAGLIVKLVERYLAEYRTLLQQDDECRQALIDVLDVFVRAGWPEALRLTYGLQDIFR